MSNFQWENVLLTSAGFFDNDEKPRAAIIERFASMLKKSYKDAKVLFIPTAALVPGDTMPEYVQFCMKDLLLLGIPLENIFSYDIDGTLTEQEAMDFDVVFFTGGNTPYLAKRVKETGFDKIIKKMVYANKVYVGISAGSMIAMTDFNVDNLIENSPGEFNGLGLIDIYFTVHCLPGTLPREDLPRLHVPLTEDQALAVRWDGYELV